MRKALYTILFYIGFLCLGVFIISIPWWTTSVAPVFILCVGTGVYLIVNIVNMIILDLQALVDRIQEKLEDLRPGSD